MKASLLLVALLFSFLLAGCGAPQGIGTVAPTTLKSQSHPGWGQKTWATLTVPANVMGYAVAEIAQLRQEFERNYKSTASSRFRLRLEVTVVASQDGFKTSSRASTPMPPESAHARDFDLGQVPKGEYSYFLMVTGQAIEYDAAGNYRQIWKTYGPRYVSNYGRNFRGQAR